MLSEFMLLSMLCRAARAPFICLSPRVQAGQLRTPMPRVAANDEAPADGPRAA